eukprot:TRINITY_DN872_c0_g1_i4.p2 TRINITY_DN872_c0_g1~~TRINITY_DN872_c0_g1_i4.p2  ORF type:complete len:134 (+),score=23.82 TRINITY_DN872_c0_g1_i4:223-624(+)
MPSCAAAIRACRSMRLSTATSATRSSSTKNAEMLNSLEGVTCNPPQGAMYAFPQITLSAKVVAAAEAAGMAPDAFYATELLEATGICVVPGSGFGQREGTYHYRTTFLPAAEKMELVTKLMTKFHAEFMDKYR